MWVQVVVCGHIINLISGAMGSYLPYTVHFINREPLAEPKRVYLDCDAIGGGMYHDVYRLYPDINPSLVDTVCVQVVENGAPLPMVVDTGLCDVPVFVLVHNNELLANKYFTRELFTKYREDYCCQCLPPGGGGGECDDTCFLLLHGCVATINDEGLLV